MRKFIFCTLAFVLLASSAFALTREAWGTSRVYGTIHNYSYDFRAESAPFSESIKSQSNATSWRGVDSLDPPCFVVTNISLVLNGKRIQFPKKAFNDLGNPGGAFAMEVKSSWPELQCILKGGDGAGSYTAVFVIKNGTLIERQIIEYVPSKDAKSVVETIKFTAP